MQYLPIILLLLINPIVCQDCISFIDQNKCITYKFHQCGWCITNQKCFQYRCDDLANKTCNGSFLINGPHDTNCPSTIPIWAAILFDIIPALIVIVMICALLVVIWMGLIWPCLVCLLKRIENLLICLHMRWILTKAEKETERILQYRQLNDDI